VVTGVFHEQIPAAFVLVESDIPVRDLPEQEIEIVLGAGSIDLLADISTAF
jgi:hypothetical protein